MAAGKDKLGETYVEIRADESKLSGGMDSAEQVVKQKTEQMGENIDENVVESSRAGSSRAGPSRAGRPIERFVLVSTVTVTKTPANTPRILPRTPPKRGCMIACSVCDTMHCC